jgi:DNA-binding NarL/FixJ family response regulator
MINVFLADDHEIFTDALSAMLVDSGEIAIVGVASNGEQVVDAVSDRTDIDVLVLDVSMPVMDGIAALIELRRRKCLIPVLMLTQELASGTITRAMKSGAAGYVLKTADREEFINAIGTVAAGGEYLSEAAKNALIARITGRHIPGEQPELTRRETEVLALIADGRRTSEIAALLFISANTVETHRRNLLQKLNLRNVAELVRYALESGNAR